MKLVRIEGLEPTRFYPLAPQASVSAYSTISAYNHRQQSLRYFTLSLVYDTSNLPFIFLLKVRSSLRFIHLFAENLLVHQPLSRLSYLDQVAGLIKHSYYFKPIGNMVSHKGFEPSLLDP